MRQNKGGIKKLPCYSVTPMEVVAIGLKVGPLRFDKCRLAALKRGLGEFAIVGDFALRIEVMPPEDARPPEGWLHEFCSPKLMTKAMALVES